MHHCTIDEVKMPNFTFYRGRKYKTTTFFFFSRTAIRSLNKMDIIATKFSAARLHFLSDVLVTVAVVVAYKLSRDFSDLFWS